MVNDVIKSNNITAIGKIFADGVFDNNDVFGCLADNRTMPCIKVRRNARVKKTNHILRNLSVISEKQFAGVEGQNCKLWKEIVDC